MKKVKVHVMSQQRSYAHPSELWLAYLDEYFDNIDWYGRYSSAVFVEALFLGCGVRVDDFESKPTLILPESSLYESKQKSGWCNKNLRCW